METATVPVVATPPNKPEVPAPEVVQVPDKFMKEGKRDDDAILKAYIELEKKVGKPAETPPATKVPEAKPPEVVAPGFEEFEKEYQKDGKLSDASYTKLAEKTGMSKQDIDDFINFRKGKVGQHESAILEAVGGKEAFDSLSTWAAANLDAEEVTSVNKLMADPKSVGAAKLALAGLKARMESVNGKSPTLVEGGVRVSDVKGYATMTDAFAVIRNPRFKTDANMRALHDKRMAASTFIESK